MKNFHSFRLGGSKFAIAGLAIALFIAQFSPATADKDVTVSRDLEAFTHINIKGGVELNLTAGKDQKIDITTEQSHVGDVKTKVKDGVLVIDLKEKSTWKFWDNVNVKITIDVPTLEGLEIAGALDGRLADIAADTFVLEIDGAADLRLEGTCNVFEMEIAGAGDVDAEDFKCTAAEVRLDGAGDVDVYASDSIDAEINGVGSMTVHGSPKDVHKQVNGIGSIKIK